MTELLDLSTVVKRDTIRIVSTKHPAGKNYELRNLADLGPMEHTQLLLKDAESKELRAKAKPTRKDETRAQQLIDEMVQMIVLDLESATFRELTPEQKQMIFTAWVTRLMTGAAEGKAAARPRTSARSSRGSKPSTAATRKRGGTRRRG